MGKKREKKGKKRRIKMRHRYRGVQLNLWGQPD